MSIAEKRVLWGPSQIDLVSQKVGWEYFANPDILSESDAKSALEETLSESFVRRTLSLTLEEPFEDILGTQVSLFQMGFKCNVYLARVISADREATLVLIQSKGGPRLNQELETDFANLGELRNILVEEGIHPFVPNPFVLDRQSKAPAFSVEALINYDEIIPEVSPISIIEEKKPYIVMVGNSTSAHAEEFNQRLNLGLGRLPIQDGLLWKLPASAVKSSISYQADAQLKTEIISRLYIVHTLMGKLPREFSLSAGDFMANLDLELDTFDPFLITIRGGWESIPAREFNAWIASNRAYATNAEYNVLKDPELIEAGIKVGQEILSQRH